MKSIEQQTFRKLILTIGVFCAFELLINFLDRANISYAALNMNADLGFNAKVYGFAVSMFFLGQILFSLPGAGLAGKFGVRRVLASIIVIWGAVAAAMSLVHTATSLYALRFLLGLAEASAAPTVTLLMANWIPRRAFGRAMMLVTVALPVGQLLGGPFSGFLMTATNGFAGQAGWRWMFAVEGLATIAFGLFAAIWVRDRPEQAAWLAPEEEQWLTAELGRDARQADVDSGDRARTSLKDVLSDGKIWLFGLILFCIATGVYLFTFWLPQVTQIGRTSASVMTITLISAIPWGGMITGMLLFGWSSDRFSERPIHLAAGMLIGGAGIAIGSAASGSPLGVLGLSIGAFGLGGAQTVFWTMPPAYMAGTKGAALAFASISLIANIAGLLTPNIIGWLRVRTGGFVSTLYLVIVLLAFGGLLIVPLARRRGTPPPLASPKLAES